jgi:hypothetical protein
MSRRFKTIVDSTWQEFRKQLTPHEKRLMTYAVKFYESQPKEELARALAIAQTFGKRNPCNLIDWK